MSTTARATAFLSLVLVSATPPAPTRAENIHSTSGALISLNRAEGVTADIRLQIDRRELKTAGEELGLDFTHVVTGVGYTLLPYLHIRGEAGWVRAERLEEEGEGGLEWGVGGTVVPIEYVVASTPEAGRKQVLGLAVDLMVRRGESNFSDEDFEWTEFEATPMLRYTSNLEAEAIWRPYEPTGISAEVGLTFSSIDGDLGPAELEENRNFGLTAGTSFRWNSGLVTRLRGTFYGDSDREIAASAGVHF